MIIDTHAHLDMEEFNGDRDEVIKRAVDSGVEKIINPGVDLVSSQKAVSLSEKYDSVYAAVGIQPEEIDQYFVNDRIKTDIRVELEKLAKNKPARRGGGKVVAIGEIGLDYYHLQNLQKESPSVEGDSLIKTQKEKQKNIFRRQLGTAILLDLPVIIHNREADEDMMSEILRYKETKKLRGVFHCFTRTLEFSQLIIDLGFMISFTGLITYPKNDELRKVIKEIPLDKVMVETDSPFLAPQSRRGQRNEPAFVAEVVKEIAMIKGVSEEEVSKITTQNAKNLFGID